VSHYCKNGSSAGTITDLKVNSNIASFWWLVLICYERKILLAGWWLVAGADLL
jgi:hypothetical protein